MIGIRDFMDLLEFSHEERHEVLYQLLYDGWAPDDPILHVLLGGLPQADGEGVGVGKCPRNKLMLSSLTVVMTILALSVASCAKPPVTTTPICHGWRTQLDGCRVIGLAALNTQECT